MTEIARGAALPRRIVRVSRTAGGVELYFPPLRLPQVALPLALFGLLAFALPAIGGAALLPAVLAKPMGMVTALLVGAFVVPFAIFGAVLMVQAFSMLAGALRVRIDRQGLTASRRLLGVRVAEKRLGHPQIVAIEARIPARHQSLFGSEPVFQLAARDAHGSAIVVAESLRGATLMSEVKALIEEALGLAQADPQSACSRRGAPRSDTIEP